MPTNPTAPHSNASVDRLALSAQSVRGSAPSHVHCMALCVPHHLEAEASGIPNGCYGCSCFEAEASYNGGAAPLCSCFEVEA